MIYLCVSRRLPSTDQKPVQKETAEHLITITSHDVLLFRASGDSIGSHTTTYVVCSATRSICAAVFLAFLYSLCQQQKHSRMPRQEDNAQSCLKSGICSAKHMYCGCEECALLRLSFFFDGVGKQIHLAPLL